MSKELTGKQAVLALAIGIFGIMTMFYVVMLTSGGKHDRLEWLLPAILFTGLFLFLPMAAILLKIVSQIIGLPFLAIWALIENIKKRKSPK